MLKSSTGPHFVVHVADFVDRSLMKAGDRVSLNQQSLSVVGILPNSLDPSFLIAIITNGRDPQPGDPRQTKMPVKGGATISEQDIKDLASYIIQANRTGEPPLTPGELAKRTIFFVGVGIVVMVFITYLLAQYNMRWIARRAAARRR